MPHGLQVQNSSGDLVIDQDFRNYEIIAEGSTSWVGTGLSSYKDISFSATALPPLVFTRSTAFGGLACATLIKTGANYTSARLYSADYFGTFAFDYFVAAPVNAASADAWGLQVFDAAGNRAFDSGKRYVQFRDVVALSLSALASSVTGYVDLSHAAVANVFFCLPALRAFLAADIDGYPATYFPAVHSLSSTSARVMRVDREFTGTWSPAYTPQSSYLVLAEKSL